MNDQLTQLGNRYWCEGHQQVHHLNDLNIDAEGRVRCPKLPDAWVLAVFVKYPTS